MKIVKPNGGTGAMSSWKYTIWAYDLGGNVMAEYGVDYLSDENKYTLNAKAHFLYGAGRLGKDLRDSTGYLNLALRPAGGYAEVQSCSSCATATLNSNPQYRYGNSVVHTRQLGYKQFELSNHTGNILSVVTDRKNAVDIGIWVPSTKSFNTGSTDNRLDYYVADVVEVTDYYPGGMPMPGRSVLDMQFQSFKRGHNGQYNDDEIYGKGNTQMAEFWEYDARLMRRWNTDPMAHAGQSLYEAFYSNPIAFADPLGLKPESGGEGGPGDEGWTPGGNGPWAEKFPSGGGIINEKERDAIVRSVESRVGDVFFVELIDPLIIPILREDNKSFTKTAQNYDAPNRSDYVINAQQFDGNYYPYPHDRNQNPDIGQTIVNGKVVSGRSSPQMFYFAVEKGKVTFGQGDPPISSDFGAGGGVPVIINGLQYGETNEYTKDAPPNLPKTGDPGTENRKYLRQRSSTGFFLQNQKNQGKTLVAYSSTKRTFMLISQENNVKNGMTLDLIRNFLVYLGYDNAMSFDGSNSATGMKDGFIIVEPHFLKDMNIPIGVMFSVPNSK